MTLNKISAEVPQEQETQVLQLVKDAKTNLDFLVDLSSEERRRLAKLSRKYVDFVDRGLLHARANPQYFPGYVSLDEFAKDMELKDCLQRIYAEVNSFAERLNDTILLVESEAYTAARVFYKSVKAAAKEGGEDAERIAKDLAYHYKKQGSPKKETENPANSNDNNNPQQPA
jgi:hypothetical protein